MSYVFKTNLSNKNNYGAERSLSVIKYIVIHYTANDGDSDEGNGNYFKNNIVKASAHYFVDSNSVTQSVPDNYVAWSVGGKKYPSCPTTGGGSLYGVCNNTNSISIEICDDIRNKVIRPSIETINNALALTKELMKKYNIPVSNVIRHFDVTGKLCPAYWCGDSTKNSLWLSEFKNRLNSTNINVNNINPPSNKKENTYIVQDGDTLFKIGTKTGVAWGTIASLNDIKPPYIIKTGQVLKLGNSTNKNISNEGFKVRPKVHLNIRRTPNGEIFKEGGARKNGVYTIVKTDGDWGLLKSFKIRENGWICISDEYVTRL